jgi:hypothetical protein
MTTPTVKHVQRRPSSEACVFNRLQQVVTRRMCVSEIEFEYLAKYGPATHRTIMMELSRLAQSEVIHRVKQGVYAP